METGGRIVNTASPGDGTITFNLRAFYRRNLVLHGLSTQKYGVKDGARVLETLADGFTAGALKLTEHGARSE